MQHIIITQDSARANELTLNANPSLYFFSPTYNSSNTDNITIFNRELHPFDPTLNEEIHTVPSNHTLVVKDSYFNLDLNPNIDRNFLVEKPLSLINFLSDRYAIEQQFHINLSGTVKLMLGDIITDSSIDIGNNSRLVIHLNNDSLTRDITFNLGINSNLSVVDYLWNNNINYMLNITNYSNSTMMLSKIPDLAIQIRPLLPNRHSTNLMNDIDLYKNNKKITQDLKNMLTQLISDYPETEYFQIINNFIANYHQIDFTKLYEDILKSCHKVLQDHLADAKINDVPDDISMLITQFEHGVIPNDLTPVELITQGLLHLDEIV